MTWRTHVVGGIATLWFLGSSAVLGASDPVGAGNPIVLSALAGFGALLPDLDAQESRIKNLTTFGIRPFFLPAVALHHALGHRGMLHSAMGLMLMAVVLGLPVGLWLGTTPMIALLLGYASHLVLDGATKAGIPLWFPNPQRLHLLPLCLRVTTGSQAEDGVLIALILLVATYFLTSI